MNKEKKPFFPPRPASPVFPQGKIIDVNLGKIMKLKTTFLAIAALVCGSSAFANEFTPVAVIPQAENSFPYISIGAGPLPLPLPLIGGGYRIQQGRHGFDACAQGTTILEVSAIQAKAMYLHYFKPNPDSQLYAGVGPSMLIGFNHDAPHTETLGTVGFALGQQYRNKAGDNRFFQADVDLPATTDALGFRVTRLPIVTVKYGFGF